MSKDEIIAIGIYLRQNLPTEQNNESKNTYLKDSSYPFVHTSKEKLS